MKPDPEKRGLMNHTMTRTRSRAVRAAGVLLCVFALAGCSTIKGWFVGQDKDKSAEPSELTELTPTATARQLRSAMAGTGSGKESCCGWVRKYDKNKAVDQIIKKK